MKTGIGPQEEVRDETLAWLQETLRIHLRQRRRLFLTTLLVVIVMALMFWLGFGDSGVSERVGMLLPMAWFPVMLTAVVAFLSGEYRSLLTSSPRINPGDSRA